MLLAMLGFAVSVNNVSLEIPALPVPQLVEQIANATGKPLYASPELGIDVVCLRAKNAELEQIKLQLANAIGAKWEVRENREVLVRPASLSAAQDAEELASRAKDIAQAIADRPELREFGEAQAGAIVAQSKNVVDQLDENFVTEAHDKARRQLWAIQDQTPPRRLLERIVRTLDPIILAQIEPGQPVVFSDQPTRMQRPLSSPTIASAKQVFQKEQATFRRMIERSGPVQYVKGDDNRYMAWEAEPEFHRMLLRVDVNRSTGMPRISLKLANKEGKVRGTAFLSLVRPRATSLGNNAWEGSFELDQSSIEWNKLFFRMVGIMEADAETKQPISQLVQPLLEAHSNPERQEPLSFSVGKAFLKFAEAQSKNLVALLSDRSLVWYEAISPKQTCQSFANFAEQKWNGKFEIKDSWISYGPNYLAEGRRDRFDRQALGKYFRLAKEQGTIKIDCAAQYAFAIHSPLLFEGYDQTVNGYTERFQGEYASSDLADWSIRPTLKFLGALSPVQRQTLLNGGSITRGQLSSQAVTALEKFVYGESFNGRGFFGKTLIGYEVDRMDILGELSEEATESLGNGIPASTRITGEAIRVPMTIQRTVGEMSYSTTNSPTSLGASLAFTESQNWEPNFEYSLGSALHFKLKIDFGSLSSSSELAEVIPGGRSKYRSWQDFPAEITRQIEASMATEREVLARRKERMKTSAPPP